MSLKKSSAEMDNIMFERNDYTEEEIVDYNKSNEFSKSDDFKVVFVMTVPVVNILFFMGVIGLCIDIKRDLSISKK